MKRLTILFACLLAVVSAGAQRATDLLDRGTVAVKTSGGVFVSWRIFAEEYYDTEYNLYRDGTKVNSTPLKVSNYVDASGTASSKYSVAPVVRGTEQAQSTAVSVWGNQYLEVKMPAAYDRSGADMSDDLEPNDVSVADVDGDGIVELLLKRKCLSDAADLYPTDNTTRYDRLEVIKLDGTLLWWIDVGPNMVSGGSVEINIVGYDWDLDGKAEVLLRAADNTVIHKADGTTQVIGDASVNTRGSVSHTANMTYTNDGAEYLLYLNGETGEPYQVIAFPLPRGAANDWGDKYGHRSSKYFFGAPFLDGRKASIFLARGIYTKHAMVAYDVDPATHELTERWRWNCSQAGSPWYGQGFHNYGIADVDWDGRDEIVYGSMVIDDNGKGLSTTGLGHGDAQHCSDLDPFRHGQEIFTCNEDRPDNNYRDATTSKIYYRQISSSDDGRSIAGNFTETQFGSIATSSHMNGCLNLTSDKIFGTGGKYIDQNFRLYWDGDLCSETFNYSSMYNSYEYGMNPRVHDFDDGDIFTFSGTKTCNSTKGTPSSSSDILGDWREEAILPTVDNKALRIYTTVDPTPWRVYTLWHDMQYRQAMVWQMCGYNQPAHTSFFLGQREGITLPPPPLTNTGRTEVTNGGSITTANNDQHVLVAATQDMTVAVSGAPSPYILTVNTPSWVQGNDDNDNITRAYYTHTFTGEGFSGDMRLVKQGDGALTLPDVTQTYKGETNIWAGTLNFDGTMENSPVWLNRFSTLNTTGTFKRKVSLEYAATVNPGGADAQGTATIDTLHLKFGARLTLDLYSEGLAADKIVCEELILDSLADEGASLDYIKPVIEVVSHALSGKTALEPGKYLIGEIGKVSGTVKIEDIELDGCNEIKAQLVYEEGKLYIEVTAFRDAATIYWVGDEGSTWDVAGVENFALADGTRTYFVPRDVVVFNDDAKSFDIVITEDILASGVRFENQKTAYTLSGDRSIVGETPLYKTGYGNVTINNTNYFTGGTTVEKGKLTVSSLAYQDGASDGSLGNIASPIVLNGGTFCTTGNVYCSQPISVSGNDTLNVDGTLLLTEGISASPSAAAWVKDGNGALTLAEKANGGTLYIARGTVNALETTGVVLTTPSTVYLHGGTLVDVNNIYTYSTCNANIVVPEGKAGLWYLDARCNYKGTLTGAGTLNLYSTDVRSYIQGNWSNFTGTINLRGSGSSAMLYFDNSYGLAKATLNNYDEFDNDGRSVNIGALNGSGTMQGSGKYTIGALGTDCTFDGQFSGCTFAKTGAGIFTVSKAQTGMASGDVTVSDGILHMSNNSYTDNMFGTNTIRVQGGELCGRSKVATVYVENGGQLTPGSATSTSKTGYIEASNVYVYDGSALNLNVRKSRGTCMSSYLVVSGSLSLRGEINITMDSGYSPAEGDSFTMWTAGSFSTAATTVVNLPELPSGFEWDYSELLTANGVLKIKSTTPLDDITGDLDVQCTVYNLAGMRVAGYESTLSQVMSDIEEIQLQRGLYIVSIVGKNYTESRKYIKR